jgi:hypothetical protein
MDNELAKQNAALASQDFGEFAGVGMENVDSTDVQIPFLGIVQKDSKQLDKDEPKYIEGAVEGDLFNTVTNELIGDGKEVYVVACCKDRSYVEWIPFKDGGGFCGTHDPASELVRACVEAAEDKFKPTTDEGHELAETFSVYCLLLPSAEATESDMPIVIAFSSSKIKVYKQQLMTPIRMIKGKVPMSAFRWKVTTVDDKNKAGKKYKNFKVEPVNGSLAESANLPGTDFQGLLSEGKSLVEAVRGGTAKADHSGLTPDRSADDGDEAF